MRKLLTTAVAALTLAGAIGAAGSADAQSRHYRRHNDTGTAIAAGVAGLALGAALSSRGSSSYSYGYGYPSYGYSYPSYGYYNQGYYAPRYRGYGRPYYAPPVRHARVCTYWAYDAWGRAYPTQRYC